MDFYIDIRMTGEVWVNLRIRSKYRKIRTRKTPYFSSSDCNSFLWPVVEIFTKESSLHETRHNLLQKIMQFQKALISWGTYCNNLACNHGSTNLFGSADNSDALPDLVHLYKFVQLKKRKKHPGEVLLNKPATLLKITIL